MSADDMIRRGDAMGFARGTVAYASIAALPAVTVGVRPLVWVEGDEPDEWKSGPYDVWCELGKFQVYYWSIVMGEPHKTADDAKAAAQADYAARILAALDLTPDSDAADDPECTDCGGSGVTYQTERHCSCQPAPDAVSVDAATAERKARSYADKPAPDAAAIREAALREAAAVAEAALNVPCVKCGVTRAQHHHRHPFVPSGVTDPVVATLALIQKGGA